MKKWLIPLILCLLASPARAEMDGTIQGFEKFAARLQTAQLSPVPITDPHMRRYGGMVGNQRVSVWVYLDKGRIAAEKVEVAIPPETKDVYALAIMNRFFQEFVGSRAMRMTLDAKLRSMRRAIIDGGTAVSMRDLDHVRMTLRLDSRIREDYPNWLFWVAEIYKTR